MTGNTANSSLWTMHPMRCVWDRWKDFVPQPEAQNNSIQFIQTFVKSIGKSNLRSSVNWQFKSLNSASCNGFDAFVAFGIVQGQNCMLQVCPAKKPEHPKRDEPFTAARAQATLPLGSITAFWKNWQNQILSSSAFAHGSFSVSHFVCVSFIILGVCKQFGTVANRDTLASKEDETRTLVPNKFMLLKKTCELDSKVQAHHSDISSLRLYQYFSCLCLKESSWNEFLQQKLKSKIDKYAIPRTGVLFHTVMPCGVALSAVTYRMFM